MPRLDLAGTLGYHFIHRSIPFIPFDCGCRLLKSPGTQTNDIICNVWSWSSANDTAFQILELSKVLSLFLDADEMAGGWDPQLWGEG